MIKVGAAYNVAGRIYTPAEDRSYDRTGVASWYGVMFHGRKTSNGEVYDMNALSAAHPTLPLPSYVRVTNLANNRSIVVRVNDRGPFKPGRIIDVSERAANLLDFKRHGTARVRVQYAGSAPLDGDDTYERRVLASQPWTAQNPNVRAAAFQPPARRLAPQPETARPSASRPGGLFVQAGLFGDPSAAYSFGNRIAVHGPVEVVPVGAGARPVHRVSLGPFGRDEDALRALNSVWREGAAGATLVRR